jgi:hypothetical protein
MPNCDTFRQFDDWEAAVAYRKATGCGGWIARNNDKGEGTIFPPGWTPSQVMRHVMCPRDATLLP